MHPRFVCKLLALSLSVALVALLPSCHAKEAPPEAPPSEPALASSTSVGQDLRADADPQAPEGAPRAARKLVRDARMTLQVEAYDEARRSLEERLAALGGFVADAEISHLDDHVSSGQLTLRVPSDRLDALMGHVATLGSVIEESLTTRDITEACYDADAHLVSARHLEARLLGLVDARTDGVKDLLAVERELARVRGQLETLEGRLRLFDNQVALSTLVLQVTTRAPALAATVTPLGKAARRTFDDSVDALAGFGRQVVLASVALAPWAPVIALAAWLLRAVTRRRRRVLGAA